MNSQTKPLKILASYDVEFSPDGNHLATISGDVVLWDVVGRRKIWRAHPLSHPSHLCFSPSGEQIGTKSTNGHIVVLDSGTGNVLCDFRNSGDGEGSNLAFSPCGSYIVDGSYDGCLKVRRAQSGQVEYVREFPGEMIMAVHHSNQGRTWFLRHWVKRIGGVCAPDYFSVWNWPFETFRIIQAERPIDWSRSSAIDASGELLAVVMGAPPRTLAIFRLADQSQVATTEVDIGGMSGALNWSQDGQFLGSVQDGKVVIYTRSGLSRELEYSLPYPGNVAFSPNGALIALGSAKCGFVLPFGIDRKAVTPAEGMLDKRRS